MIVKFTHFVNDKIMELLILGDCAHWMDSDVSKGGWFQRNAQIKNFPFVLAITLD